MNQYSFGIVALLCSSPAIADCGVDLSFGRIKLGGISAAREDALLTSKYTMVRSSIKNSSNVTELSFECENTHGFALSLSHLTGVKVSITRDVFFTGYDGRGISIPPGYLTTVHEEVKASANRFSAIQYFDYGFVAPFLRIGVEQVHASGRAWVTVQGFTIAKEESRSKSAPYLGFGVAFARKGPFTVRLEAQVMSIKPHQVQMYTVGIHGQF